MPIGVRHLATRSSGYEERPEEFLNRMKALYNFEVEAGPFFMPGLNPWNRAYVLAYLPQHNVHFRLSFWRHINTKAGTYRLGDGMKHMLEYGIPVKYPHKDCPAGDA